jgi:hypothetical protein
MWQAEVKVLWHSPFSLCTFDHQAIPCSSAPLLCVFFIALICMHPTDHTV